MVDDHTRDLFEDAIKLGDRLVAEFEKTKAGKLGLSHSQAVDLAGHQFNATARIFAALVEADLARQIREARELNDVG